MSIKNLKKNIEYDDKLDILYIYHDRKKEVMSSLPIGNFVFDIASDGSLVGMEIDNATNVLNVKKSQLENIRKANLNISTNSHNHTVLFSFSIQLPNEKITQSCLISEAPVFGRKNKTLRVA